MPAQKDGVHVYPFKKYTERQVGVEQSQLTTFFTVCRANTQISIRV